VRNTTLTSLPRPLPRSLTGRPARLILLAAVLVPLPSCAPRQVPVAESTMAADAATLSAVRPMPKGDLALEETPVVVVRDYPNSPVATIVAWTEEEPWQGLRAEVRRDGTMVPYHRLFVNVNAFYNPGNFAGADWRAFARSMKESQALVSEGVHNDRFYCDGGKGCSPNTVFLVRIRDDFLRGSKESEQDSVKVKIFARNGEQSSVTLYRPLITTYLATLDSVVAARRGRIGQ
jgi:hypothetical protein